MSKAPLPVTVNLANHLDSAPRNELPRRMQLLAVALCQDSDFKAEEQSVLEIEVKGRLYQGRDVARVVDWCVAWRGRGVGVGSTASALATTDSLLLAEERMRVTQPEQQGYRVLSSPCVLPQAAAEGPAVVRAGHRRQNQRPLVRRCGTAAGRHIWLLLRLVPIPERAGVSCPIACLRALRGRQGRHGIGGWAHR